MNRFACQTMHGNPYMDLKRKFAWLPVRLSVFRAGWWHVTKRRAWLRWVSVHETVWCETFYTEIE